MGVLKKLREEIRWRRKLRFARIQDGLIAPLRFLPGQEHFEPHAKTAETGVYKADGTLVANSLLLRDINWKGVAGKFHSEKAVNQDVIYAGPLIDHFGHFLLEGIAHLWCIRDMPNHAIAWSVPEGASDSSLKRWQSQILDVLGLDAPVILVSQPTTFRSVVVTETGCRLYDRLHAQHAAFLCENGPPHDPKPGKKLWLSRSRFQPDKGLLGVELLEKRLQDAGWEILYPETMDIAEQVKAIASAERIAGEEGSALHTVVFLANAHRLRLDIFARFRNVDRYGQAYDAIAKFKGFQQDIHDLKDLVFVEKNGPQVTQIGQNFAQHLDALSVPLDAALPDRVHMPTAASLNGMIDGSVARYLQIGWSNATAFFGVNATSKTLVAPMFPFDPRAGKKAGHEIYEMTPQRYFQYFAQDAAAFDLIYLEGSLDLSPLADSVTVSHDTTIWAISAPAQEAPAIVEKLRMDFPQFTVVPQKTHGEGVIFLQKNGASETPP